MKIKIQSLVYGALAASLLCANAAWSVCNTDAETNASSVLDLQGQGNFSCAQLSGPGGTMEPLPDFRFQIDNLGGRKVITWDANGDQADYVFAEDGGQGGRCLYQFDAVSSGSFLEPASSKATVTGCWDGLNTVVPELPKEPISSLDGRCDGELEGIQDALDGGQGDLALVITEDADGEYLPGICASGGQTRCAEQCIAPTDMVYNCDELALAPGERCLSERACALAEELYNGTGDSDVDQFCWELSHSVDTFAGTFSPETTKEKAVFSVEGIKGSHCRKVTTTYRGKVYSYYSPSDCPH